MARIVIVAGSKSDLPHITSSKMLATIESVGIDFSLNVASAHRNAPQVASLPSVHPDAQAYIGVAGLAAALPGALAGATDMAIPIIGVALDEHGIDSCLYMPPGVPVLLAGVGSTGLKNAAIAALQIAARSTDEVDRFAAWRTANRKAAEFDIDPATIGGN